MRLYAILLTLGALFGTVEAQAVKALEGGDGAEVVVSEQEKTISAQRVRIAELEAAVKVLQDGNIRLEAEKVREHESFLRVSGDSDRLGKEVVRLKSESAKLSRELEKALTAVKSVTLELDKEKAAHVSKDVRLTEERAKNAALSGNVKLLEQEKLRLESDISGLSTGHEQSLKAANEQNAVMRKELLGALSRLGDRNERLRRYERSAASIIETLSPVYVSGRERELGADLELVMNSGMRLASKGADVCSGILPRLGGFGLDPVDEAKLRVMFEELSAQVGLFARLSGAGRPAEAFESCRILEVDDSLGVVILGAGYRDGARVNMALASEGAESVVFKIVSLRPFVSAAIPESGSVRGFSPGMRLRANLK